MEGNPHYYYYFENKLPKLLLHNGVFCEFLSGFGVNSDHGSFHHNTKKNLIIKTQNISDGIREFTSKPD